jgi:hypothetical protein
MERHTNGFVLMISEKHNYLKIRTEKDVPEICNLVPANRYRRYTYQTLIYIPYSCIKNMSY